MNEPMGKAQGWIGRGASGWTGGSGTAPGKEFGSFDHPTGLCVLPCGDILVADFINHRICRWSAEGDPVGWIGLGGDGIEGWQQADGAAGGSELGAFLYPRAVCSDTAGNIYVADRDNHRIVKWTDDGRPVGWIGGGGEGWQTGSGAPPGSSAGAFDTPCGVYVHSDGSIYVADSRNHRISLWTPAGRSSGWIGGGLKGWQTGIGAGEKSEEGWFRWPEGVTVDGRGNIYVAESGNDRVSRWSILGHPTGWIGGGESGWHSGPGAAPDRDAASFNRPTAICLDEDGRLLVAEYLNFRVSRWDLDGNALGYIGSGIEGWWTGKTWFQPSSGETEFDSPFGVAASGPTLYVGDSGNHRVCRWLR
jgi:DNA-binding beta-propeller fold protein YncE